MLMNGAGDSHRDPNPGGVRIGTAGWHYDDWKGIVHPRTMPRGTTPLSLLSTWFDLVEINVTYYRPIAPARVKSWLEHVCGNPRFLFTAKVPQAFTHQRDPWPGDEAARMFCSSLAPLWDAGRLGAVLAQFPWSFRRTQENRQYLARLAEVFSGMPLAVEVRHDSWDHPDFFASLREKGIAFCNIDQPELNACLRPTAQATTRFGYVRLHGRNAAHWFGEGSVRNARYDYLYDGKEMAGWMERILRLRAQVNDLFVVTNNHYRGQAVVNALEIQAALGVFPQHLPATLLETYPRLQACLASSAGR